MKKIYSKQKNSKSLNILEQFWYPGHFHSSKTQKIRGGIGGGGYKIEVNAVVCCHIQ